MKNSAIENQFKEKMNAREITPSKVSWDRLDAMLAVAEKPKRSFKWMYVAASLLGFLLFGTFYFDQNNNDTVDVKDAIKVREKEVTIPEQKIEPVKMNLQKIVKTGKVFEGDLASAKNNLKTDSNSVVSNKENQPTQKEIIQEEQITIINQKAEQPIASQKSNYVNVDELLASVDNASKKGSMAAKPIVKVNSNQLLTQVDSELDLTFREKAIKTVSQNFKAAKLALSNRNSE